MILGFAGGGGQSFLLCAAAVPETPLGWAKKFAWLAEHR